MGMPLKPEAVIPQLMKDLVPELVFVDKPDRVKLQFS